MNYRDYNDYELIYQVKDNDEEAYNVIFNKYAQIARKIAYKYSKIFSGFGIEYEDLCQEGYIAITEAISKYDGETSKFYTYVTICIKRDIEKYVKCHMRKKHKALNESISLSSPVCDDDLLLEDVIESSCDIESYILNEELREKLYDFKYLINFEDSLVYELLLSSASMKEISVLLDVGYNDVKRIIRKNNKSLNEYLKKEYA